MRRSLLVILALAAVVVAAPGLAGQAPDAGTLRPSGFEAGIAGAVAQPVGDFDRQVGTSGGFSIYGAYHVTPAFSMRAEGTYLIYGHERRRDCAAVTCRVTLNIDTNNQIVSGFLGPQLEVPYGPVRPYARAGVGVGYFFTTSSLSGTVGESFASTTNYHDGVFAWTGGGGVNVPFSVHRLPVAVDLGATYQRNGNVTYLRKGTGIIDNPDGTITLNPTTGPADFVQWHLGVSVAIPHSTGHRR